MARNEIPFETLIADLHGSDWTRRCDAARMLGQSGDARAVDALLPDLKDPDWKVRRNAAQALGALKSEKAVDGLLEALKDRVATVRERAAVALGRIKDPRAIPALVEAVIEEKDAKHFHVNEGAFQAVRKFKKKAGPALVERLKTKPNVYLVELLADSKYDASLDLFITLLGSHDPGLRRAVLTAFGKFGDPRAVDILTGVLESGDGETQVLAIQGLGKLRALQAAPKLLDLLQDDPLLGPRAELYRAITDAFQEFGGIKKDIANAFPTNSKLSFNVAGAGTSLAGMMGMLGDDSFQKLNAMFTDAERRAEDLKGKFNLPPQVIQNMVDQTWKFGATLADARDAKEEQVKMLIALLKSDSAMVRTAAALSLPWYMDARALDPLDQATHDQDEMVQRASMWAYLTLNKMSPHQKG